MWFRNCIATIAGALCARVSVACLSAVILDCFVAYAVCHAAVTILRALRALRPLRVVIRCVYVCVLVCVLVCVHDWVCVFSSCAVQKREHQGRGVRAVSLHSGHLQRVRFL